MEIPCRFLYGVWVFCFLICPISDVWADQQDDNDLSFPPIIVSTSRSQMLSSQVADQAEVLTAEDLQDLPVKNLAEALNYMPGVDVQNSGPLGQAASVSIRGSDSRQVLVMVDGIPFNTQLSGQANLSEIPIEDIQQIEVIKGGGSSAWGSSLGGVINVITKPVGTSSQPHGDWTTGFGQFDTFKNSFDLEDKVGNFGFSTFGSYLDAHGNLADSRTKEVKDFSKLEYDFNDTTNITASFGYSGSNLRYGPTFDDLIYKQPYISRYGQIQLNVDKGQNRMTVAYKYNDQDITTEFDDSSTWTPVFPAVVSRDLYQGLSLNDVYEITADHLLTTGFDADWHVLKSDPYLSASKSMSTVAPYSNLLWRIENWDFIPGLRFDDNSHFGSQLSPSFGIVYHVPQWQDGVIRVKAARAFNAPPLLWLYNNSPDFFVVPNPALKAERALTYEVGAEGPLLIKGLKGELNLYRSDVTDALSPVTDMTTFLTQFQNINKAVRQGGDVRLDYSLNKRWSVFSGFSFNDVRDEETKQIIRDAGIARESFKWGSSYSWPFGLKLSLEGYYNRWSSLPGEANDRKPIFDLKLTQDFKNIYKGIDAQVFFNLYNLTNSSYWADPTFPLPGRYVEGGFSLKF